MSWKPLGEGRQEAEHSVRCSEVQRNSIKLKLIIKRLEKGKEQRNQKPLQKHPPKKKKKNTPQHQPPLKTSVSQLTPAAVPVKLKGESGIWRGKGKGSAGKGK